MSQATPAAPAADLPVKNLGFETWEEGRPQGWHVGNAKAYRVSADCADAPEGKCSARLESLAGEAVTFVPLVQNMPSRHAAGHFIQLSGMIRTENVVGHAGLWLRVDAADRPNIVLENMRRTGPRGTTPWQRFSITVPVAPDTSNVGFGVLLSGTGIAWFDDLRLTVDRETKVEPEVPVALPPRPRPDSALRNDAALALHGDEVPQAKAEWVEDVRGRAHPIRSLFSDDFSDLRFLAPLLEGRRVVQLGESGHGVAEFNWLKARLIRYLHRELGYDVIAFESSLSGCDVADGLVVAAPAMEVMRQCVFGVWHSTETLGVFEYLEATRKAGRRLTLAGFDIQNSGTARTEVARRLVALADAVSPELGRAIESHERRLGGQITREEADHMSRAYLALAKGLEDSRDRLGAAGTSPRAIDLAIQESRSRSRLVHMAVYGRPTFESHRIRDEGMAENLDFLLDRLHPGRKVIVWAHNTHIARHDEGFGQPHWMGSWVDRRRGREVYTIGIYMGRGAAAHNHRRHYAIAAPPADSLEAVLANARMRMSFVDFSRVLPARGNEWMFEPIIARSWGLYPMKVRAAKAYDGVIYVDTVTPPEYR
ncbi:MAG TPA: erythromycin esterase family protein [Usitatibacter sp.]|nr:erythromycin esterase family protein [Usitatibacter sp.]